MKKIILLGATGTIGKVVSERLVAKNYKVFGVSRNLPTEKILGVEYFLADVEKKDDLEKILCDAEVVINCTGMVSFLQKDAKKLWQSNVEAVKNVVEILNTSSKIEKYIHLSSAASFGVQTIFDEHSVPNFMGLKKKLPYAYSKFCGQKVLQETANFPFCNVCPVFVLDEKTKKNIQQKLKKLPFFVAPPGKNGIVLAENLAKKIVELVQSEYLPKKILLSDKTVKFSDLPAFFGVSKKTLVLPFWSKNVCVLVASCLEKIGFAMSTEKVFWGFCEREVKK